MPEKEVDRLIGVLEEWKPDEVIAALAKMGIETPRTTIASDSNELLVEKLKGIVAILESGRVRRAISKIDTSKEVRDEAKKDVVAYLKKEGIEFPEGVVVVIREEVQERRAAAGNGDIEIEITIKIKIPKKRT